MSGRYRFGLIGHNIGYSLSPAIFDLLFLYFGSAGEFTVFDWDETQLMAGIGLLKELDGFSVTIPFKVRMASRVDAMDEVAEQAGAINSVRVRRGRLLGANTDVSGFLYPLASVADMKRVTVFGYGGAARAVVYALCTRYKDVEIYIGGRSRSGIAAFVTEMESPARRWNGRLMGLERNGFPAEGSDLIVNCTPVGNAENPQSCPVHDAYDYSTTRICYDVHYRPEATTFLGRAAAAGCQTINGLPMLFAQAVASYAFWTGERIDTAKVCGDLITKFTRQNQGAH